MQPLVKLMKMRRIEMLTFIALAIFSCTSFQVTDTTFTADLTWTAPGDDSTNGVATYYDLIYTTDTLVDPEEWPYIEIKAPAPAGTIEDISITVDISETGGDKDYYFRIRAIDDAFNCSVWSPITTIHIPEVIKPAQIMDLIIRLSESE